MLSVFVDCHVFDGIFQGSRSYIKGLYSSLIQMAPDILFYLAAYDLDNLKKEFGIHDNVFYLKYKSRNKFYRLAIDIPFLIKKHRIDYAHFQYIRPLIKTCKEIVTIHDVLFLDYPEYFSLKYRIVYNFLFKFTAKTSDILLTVSNYSKERISLYYSINKENIFVTPNGISLVNGSSISFDNNFILYVSRIEPRKNHIALLRAFVETRLYEKGVDLVIAGKKVVNIPIMDSYINSLPPTVKKHIIFCTPDDKELDELFNSCKFFVYPSLAEGFGIPPLEAALHCKLVLCSSSSAMQEFSDLGFIMFDPKNELALKEKMLYCCNINLNNIDYDAIIQNIMSRYNWDISAKILLSKIR